MFCMLPVRIGAVRVALGVPKNSLLFFNFYRNGRTENHILGTCELNDRSGEENWDAHLNTIEIRL